MAAFRSIIHYNNWLYRVVGHSEKYELVQGVNETTGEKTAKFEYDLGGLPESISNQLRNKGVVASIQSEMLKYQIAQRIYDKTQANRLMFGYAFELIENYGHLVADCNVVNFRGKDTFQLFDCFQILGLEQDLHFYLMQLNETGNDAVLTLSPDNHVRRCPTYRVPLSKLQKVKLSDFM